MQFINKRVYLGTALGLAFLSSAVAYSVGYSIAMERFNSIISFNYEKQQIYSRLSEVDNIIREEYIGEIDESILVQKICEGYMNGIDTDGLGCQYLSFEQYRHNTALTSKKDNSLTYDIIEGNIGYIKIRNINSESGNMFENAVKSLQGDGAGKFIFDFRQLMGGDIQAAEKILDIILPEGYTINSINKKGEKTEIYKTFSTGITSDISILVSRKTEGIPELISMAVKGKENVHLIGESTSGKILEKKVIQLSDGSAIVFPIAYYSINNDEPYKDKKVSPDIEVPLMNNMLDAILADEVAYQDDVQIKEAISVIS